MIIIQNLVEKFIQMRPFPTSLNVIDQRLRSIELKMVINCDQHLQIRKYYNFPQFFGQLAQLALTKKRWYVAPNKVQHHGGFMKLSQYLVTKFKLLVTKFIITKLMHAPNPFSHPYFVSSRANIIYPTCLVFTFKNYIKNMTNNNDILCSL